MKTMKVIADWDGAEWVLMFADGTTAIHPTEAGAFGAIARRAARLARTTGRNIVTTIEWRNIPEGFEVPESSR